MFIDFDLIDNLKPCFGMWGRYAAYLGVVSCIWTGGRMKQVTRWWNTYWQLRLDHLNCC